MYTFSLSAVLFRCVSFPSFALARGLVVPPTCVFSSGFFFLFFASLNFTLFYAVARCASHIGACACLSTASGAANVKF